MSPLDHYAEMLSLQAQLAYSAARSLRVLVACEFSGVVRDAFASRGHFSMSCDLLPSEAPGPHYKGDVRDVLDFPWDLMVCSALCATMTA